MTRLQNIVAATDFSESSLRAVEQAAFLARAWGARLMLVHVFNDSAWASIRAIYDLPGWSNANPLKLAQTRLEELGKQIAKDFGLQPQAEILTGRASQQISRLVADRCADLLVVGEHGENWIAGVALGGTALKVIEAARLPVLLVRRPAPDTYRKVLVATDFSPASARAACLAVDYFPEARHELIHAYLVPFESSMRLGGARDEDVQYYRDREFAAASTQLETFAKDCGHSAKDGFERIALYGSPTAVILEQVRAGGGDLVAIGKHGGHYVEELLLGSVTQNILYHAGCDVLLVA